jgi:mannitol-1-phosphate 5-dehydrogenase
MIMAIFLLEGSHSGHWKDPGKKDVHLLKQAVIFGAGNIGRGFIGQLFSESGYAVTFVDVVQPLIEALNARRAYMIHLVDNERTEKVDVGPVRAIHAGDVDAVVHAVAGASVMATAVGARALPFVAPNIAAGVRRRMQAGVKEPLDCIVCENLKGAAGILRDQVGEHLAPGGQRATGGQRTSDEQAYLRCHLGFVDTVIGRMVPPLTPEMRAQDPSMIRVEPYKELPVDRSGFIGPIPPIAAMEVCDNFAVYTARKLYVHNCGHAVLAYMGYLRGYSYGYQALADPEIASALGDVWQESIAGQVQAYGVEAAWLQAHAQELRVRFANRALGDTVYRLGRDPIRKLGPDDRLVAPARLAEAAGVVPHALARVIAAALRFDPPEDTVAVALQQQLSQQGLETVLDRVCQIRPHEPLTALIRQSYQDLTP